MMRNFEDFFSGYIVALLWSSTDTKNGETIELDSYQLSPEALDKSRADCRKFFSVNRVDLVRAAQSYPHNGEYTGFELAGHDFALTRNGHGAGFWDGDLPDELGDRLTAASKSAGEVWPYLSDAGDVGIE